METDDRYVKLAMLLEKNFAIYGYGNFDLTTEETAKILELLGGDNPEAELEALYVQLKAIRLG